MQIFKHLSNNSKQILALGPESNGNFSFFKNGQIYFSEDFGDLLVDANFNKFKKALNEFLKKEQIEPNIILTDLHPLYRTTELGKILAKKYKAHHIQIQHHLAHIFSSIGEYMIISNKFSNSFFGVCPVKHDGVFYGVALDGTGYGTDGKIWGGEIFKIQYFPKAQPSENRRLNLRKIQRIGHLENQILLGGELAIQEPARMLISILDKFPTSNFQFPINSQFINSKNKQKFIYSFVEKYYSRNEFELLYNQLQQNFNCVETSSTGRVLDAVSILLGFCINERKHKHEPIELLEKNSSKPYANLKPVILNNLLMTTPLFEYLVKNLNKDKKRLAATAQLYIAEGLDEIIKIQAKNYPPQIFLAGGIANNKIISEYFESKNIYPVKLSRSEFIGVPRGDAGLSFGQIIYYLLNF